MHTTKEFRTQVYSYYEENGIVVGDPSVGNWEYAHIVPQCKGGTETVLLLHGHHIIHDIIQSREYNHCCFFSGNVYKWLYGEGFLCAYWFELVELYEHYTSRHNTQNATDRWAKITPEERSAKAALRIGATPEGRSTEMGRRRRQGWAALAPEERTLIMAPIQAARWAKVTPEEKSAHGRRAVEARWAKVRAERALRSLGADLYGALWAAEPL